MVEIFSEVNKNVEYVDVQAPANCGSILININEEEFNADMQRQLVGVKFTVYRKVTGTSKTEYIPYEGRSYVWNTGKDLEMILESLPSEFSIGCMPIIDESARNTRKDFVMYDVFPITISFDGQIEEISELVGSGF